MAISQFSIGGSPWGLVGGGIVEAIVDIAGIFRSGCKLMALVGSND